MKQTTIVQKADDRHMTLAELRAFVEDTDLYPPDTEVKGKVRLTGHIHELTAIAST